MTLDIESMLREDRSEWEALVAVLEAHPREVLHAPASPWKWTSRDVYAHLARWLNHSTDVMEARLRGASLPSLAGSEDQINRRWQREDSSLGLEEARGRARGAFERRARFLQQAPAGFWTESMISLARENGAAHYRDHRSYIVVR